jgi:hypothetical protein
MTIIDHLPTLPRRAPASIAPPSSPECDEAKELVADLAALMQAGLITVRRQLGGPARYGAVVDLDEGAS